MTLDKISVAPPGGDPFLQHGNRHLLAHITIHNVGQIEHSVPSFDGWKQTSDSGPIGRAKSGVRHYQVLRPMNIQNYVMIDLEFDSVSQAEAVLAAMRVVWGRVEGAITMNP